VRKQAALRQADILNVLNAHDGPMTAYEILEELQAEEPDIAPPTVYRTLAALTEQGRAHRLESLKAFVPCRCDHAESLPILAICEDCGCVEEQDGGTLLPKLGTIAQQNGFRAHRHIIELHGRCSDCSA